MLKSLFAYFAARSRLSSFIIVLKYLILNSSVLLFLANSSTNFLFVIILFYIFNNLLKLYLTKSHFFNGIAVNSNQFKISISPSYLESCSHSYNTYNASPYCKPLIKQLPLRSLNLFNSVLFNLEAFLSFYKN